MATASRATSIKNTYGFHVRPSTTFYKLANTFKSSITVEANGQAVDGKSIMALMGLGAHQGVEVNISCDGDDAEAACTALVALVDSRFNGIE